MNWITVGVVEHGLFLNMISKVIVGTPDGPVIIENRVGRNR